MVDNGADVTTYEFSCLPSRDSSYVCKFELYLPDGNSCNLFCEIFYERSVCVKCVKSSVNTESWISESTFGPVGNPQRSAYVSVRVC